MSTRNILLSVVAGAIVIYAVAAPYLTVYSMRTAAENQDSEALSEHVDFPSVRQSLKDQLNASFAKEMAEDEELKGNPFAALGMALAGTMVDKMVDAYVTPAGIHQLMVGQKPKREPDNGQEQRSEARPFSDASMSYESLSKFVVEVDNEDGGTGRFVFRRQGIGWKLTDILIPLD